MSIGKVQVEKRTTVKKRIGSVRGILIPLPELPPIVNLSNSRITSYFASGLLSLLVGALDYSTGSEIRVLPLYYLALILAGWKLGKSGALLSGLFSTVIWLGVAIAEGAHYSS